MGHMGASVKSYKGQETSSIHHILHITGVWHSKSISNPHEVKNVKVGAKITCNSENPLPEFKKIDIHPYCSRLAPCSVDLLE